MAKNGVASLSGYALTGIITTPDTTFIEYSKPAKDGATETITFVDRGSDGLDRGDKFIISKKMETGANQCRHRRVNDETIKTLGNELKKLVEGARGGRMRVLAGIPKAGFEKGECSIYGEDCTAVGTFQPYLTLQTGVRETTYLENDLCPEEGSGLKRFDPANCDQVYSRFEYTGANGQPPLQVGVRRRSDIDEEFGYTNTFGMEQQLGRYYRLGDLPAPALDVFYTTEGHAGVPGVKYLHLDLGKDEVAAPATKAGL